VDKEKQPVVLEVSKPFDIDCDKASKGSKRHIGKEHTKKFWDKEANVYATKQGCYIFALKASKGYTPWYVGKATKGFKQECFNPLNLNRYNEVLFKGRRGKPVIFFIARGGHKNKVPAGIVDELETYLIQTAFGKNPDILNRAKTGKPNWRIKGAVRAGRGKPDMTAKAFTTMMNLC
jgi:hypothetical protein